MSSTWFFLYAADVDPRSAVCRKNVGSLEPRLRAISSLDIVSVFSVDIGFASGEGALSVASESGRDLTPRSEPGRCCHDRVPARFGIAAGLGGRAGFCGSIGRVGDRVSSLDSVSSFACLFMPEGSVRGGGSLSIGKSRGDAEGDADKSGCLALIRGDAYDRGVVEDERFSGDKDRARS